MDVMSRGVSGEVSALFHLVPLPAGRRLPLCHRAADDMPAGCCQAGGRGWRMATCRNGIPEDRVRYIYGFSRNRFYRILFVSRARGLMIG
jgi:hypothetical protein